MGAVGLEDILVTPMKRIHVKGGDVLHAMKVSDPDEVSHMAMEDFNFNWKLE